MNTLEALKAEIETAPEPVLKQAYDFVVFLKTRTPPQPVPAAPRQWPDFAARLQAQYGDRVLADSQGIMDDMREDRF
ncbi:MAG: hypothetical protein JWO89_2060 [Verrucomicrobiaceae bacterium]|nr:hypothetical protein [Verrucomicrobiaceae bacterium]